LKSKVYFASARLKGRVGLLEKLEDFFNLLEISRRVRDGEIVGVKVHFGERGHTRYVRPSFVRKAVELLKDAGGRPFVTDTTTLYRHKRHTLFDHLETASWNGFTPETMGCPVIIADGLKSNGVEVKVDGKLKFGRVKVAQAIFDADALLCFSHLTFHPFVTPAASIKNVAMGCTTKGMKLQMHSLSKAPLFKEERCVKCYSCCRVCPSGALRKVDQGVEYDSSKCVGCGECIAECRGDALVVPWNSMKHVDVQMGVIDAFRGVCSTFGDGRLWFINVALDVTEFCDCLERADLPVVPDIGLFASCDPLAVDVAAYNCVAESCGYPGSKLNGEDGEKGERLFPGVDAQRFFKLCEEAGIGTTEYELVEV
jgi:hypothetical protein